MSRMAFRQPAPEPTPCPESRPFDRFLAIVYMPNDIIVTVNIPLSVHVGYGEGPYDTLEGMEAVVNGLRLKQPGE
jgi:hypothetical protein